jgi:hypothetical protein
MRCNSCEALTINGVYCHETGCPDAWRDYQNECKFCGSLFTPEYRGQQYCDDSCNDTIPE